MLPEKWPVLLKYGQNIPCFNGEAPKVRCTSEAERSFRLVNIEARKNVCEKEICYIKGILEHAQFHLRTIQAAKDNLESHISWNDKSFPSINPNLARLHYAYHYEVFTALRPFVHTASAADLDSEAHNAQFFNEITYKWMIAAFQAIRAFDSPPKVEVDIDILHTRFGILLELVALRESSNYHLLVSTEEVSAYIDDQLASTIRTLSQSDCQELKTDAEFLGNIPNSTHQRNGFSSRSMYEFPTGTGMPTLAEEIISGINTTTRIQQTFQASKELQAELNPARFSKIGKEIFLERPHVRTLLEEFHMQKIPYCEVWPEDSTFGLVRGARVRGTPIHTTLYMVISMPRSVYQASKPTKLKLSVDFHGGGGFTGDPSFEPWVYWPRLEYMSLAQNILSIEPQSLLMPQSQGPEILQANRKALSWLFDGLEHTLHGINSNLAVDWESFNISGHSFGGMMALDFFRQIGLHASRPPNLHVRTVHARGTMSRPYERQASTYMGQIVSQEEAEEIAKKIRLNMSRLKDRGCMILKRAGSTPPDGMIGAYSTSVSRAEGTTWLDFWAERCLYELLDQMASCPDERACILFEHGTADNFVPFEHSLGTQAMLKAKFPKLDVRCNLIPNEDHAWDYDRKLAEIKWFFQLY
ncbi:hypothetical protein T440DRAFT_523500 [Plenodomus tracheiphilus IPT5]|uniref:Alpha/beta-hydrolase n=1 Tax=Plenodomus tracheiphilus IPT5 TaxID=1408161 RepID=A0A6A7AQK8_9PLEO|nr:hypothetical protein T440DRAFT_523500 [Plenodomus tracheiphilus IPT5]